MTRGEVSIRKYIYNGRIVFSGRISAQINTKTKEEEGKFEGGGGEDKSQ